MRAIARPVMRQVYSPLMVCVERAASIWLLISMAVVSMIAGCETPRVLD